MHRRIGSPGSEWLAAGVLLLVSTSCWERNPDFIGGAGAGSSSGTGSSSTSSSTSSPTTADSSGPVTTTGMMTTVGVDDTGSTSLEPGTSTGPVSVDSSSSDTGNAASSGSTSSTSSGGSSTTGAEEPLYPPCMLEAIPVCPLPYEDCYDAAAPDFTACTLPCMQDDECPQPLTGDAPAVCAGAGGDQCVIDCSGGAVCPDGMDCQMVGPGGMFERCLWPS